MVSNRSGAGGIGGLLAMYDVENTTGYGYFYNGNGDLGPVVKHSHGTIGAKYQYDPYAMRSRAAARSISRGASARSNWMKKAGFITTIIDTTGRDGEDGRAGI